MEKNVLNTDLSGKVAVVTGASGTLCSIFAKALARAGAKVALLGRNMEKLKELANAIEAEGGVAKGYTCNVMNKANCLQVAEEVMADLGPCDILVNGAGGNNPRANTDKEFFEMADLDDDTVTFFDLDESGVEMVFNLNFIGTLLPTQAFARQMVGRPGCNIMNISSMNAYPAPDQDPGLLRLQGCRHQLHPVAGSALQQGGHPGQRHCPGLLCQRAERTAPLQRGRHPHRPHRKDPGCHPHGPLRRQRKGSGGCPAVPAEQRGCRLYHRYLPAH